MVKRGGSEVVTVSSKMTVLWNVACEAAREKIWRHPDLQGDKRRAINGMMTDDRAVVPQTVLDELDSGFHTPCTSLGGLVIRQWWRR